MPTNDNGMSTTMLVQPQGGWGNNYGVPYADPMYGNYGGGLGGFGGDWSGFLILFLFAMMFGGGFGGYGMGGFGGFGSYDGGSYDSYDSYDGMSNARGRGRNAKRDSMGRYSSERGYSRDDAKKDMMKQLSDIMQNAPDERTRSELANFMNSFDRS